MSLATLQAAAEAAMDWPALETAQADALAETGGYAQQTLDLDALPDDDFGHAVDVYDGPAGRGFVVRLFARFGGDLYVRAYDYGPEGRSRAWRPLIERNP